MVRYTTTFGNKLITVAPIIDLKIRDAIYKDGVSSINVKLIGFESPEHGKQFFKISKDKEFISFPSTIDTLEVDDVYGFWVIIIPRGCSIRYLLSSTAQAPGPIHLFSNYGITKVYQKILSDLVILVREMMDNPFKGRLNVDSIYIEIKDTNRDYPLVTIVDIQYRGNADYNIEWDEVANLVVDLNQLSTYATCSHKREMESFISALTHHDRRAMDSLATSPLFWSHCERLNFLHSLYEDLKGHGNNWYVDIKMVVDSNCLGEDNADWSSMIPSNSLLRMINPTKSGEPVIDALKFISDSISYVTSNQNNSTVQVVSLEALQREIDITFPNIVMAFYESISNHPRKESFMKRRIKGLENLLLE